MLDSSGLQALVRRAAAALIGCLLAVVLIGALLLAGVFLLLRAMALALIPIWGEPVALAVTGAVCLCIVAGLFAVLLRPARASAGKARASGRDMSSPLAMLRQLIKDNPLESAMTAFALGVVEQGDPRLRSLLLQGGMELMKGGEVSASDGGNHPAPSSAEPSSAEH